MSSQVQAGRRDAPSRDAPRRQRAEFAAAAVRLGMRALSHVSPVLAARVMDYLWFRAPRTQPQGEAQACLARGRRLALRVDGHRVAMWEWGDAGPCVLLLHGWGGHAGQLHAFVAPLLAAGMRVVAFDAPAHGASGASRHGRHRVTFFEFAAALQALTRRFGPLAGVVAHSGGCTAIALAMRKGWRAPQRMVFVAPFCEPAAAVDGFARRLGIAGESVQRFRTHAARWLGLAWSDLDIAALPDQLRGGPLLVLHDRDDREVPIAQSAALGRGVARCTAGRDHRRRSPQDIAASSGSGGRCCLPHYRGSADADRSRLLVGLPAGQLTRRPGPGLRGDGNILAAPCLHAVISHPRLANPRMRLLGPLDQRAQRRQHRFAKR